MPPGVPEASCRAFVEAFANKDAKALSDLLSAHPVLATVLLTRRTQPVGRRELTLPLSHMAIKTGWLHGLDVLARHGVDFDQRADPSGYTALGFAVAQGSLPAVRRLLALGAPADDPAGSMPALAVLPSVWPKSDRRRQQWPAKATQMAAELVSAGANPWKLSGAEGSQVPVVQICLRWGRPELAATLLSFAPPPVHWRHDETAVEDFQQEWLTSFAKGSLDDHRFLFDALSGHGLLPALERMLAELSEAQDRSSVYAPSTHTPRQVLEDVIVRGLQEKHFGPVATEHVELVNKPGLEGIHARLLRDWLDQGTAASSLSCRHPQPRL